MADLSKIRKNGVDYDIKDATARAAIEELKQNGTGGGTTTETVTEYSGVVLKMDCNKRCKIAVSGETTETVNLYHCGKNMMPAYAGADTTKNGTSVVKNLDGTITLKGASTGNSYFDMPKFFLPAGEYTMIPVGFPKESGPISFVIQSTEGGITKAVAVDGGLSHFTLENPTAFTGYYNVRPTFTGEEMTLSVMLVNENIYPACDYEAPTINKINATFPVTLDAYDGVNILYTDGGDALNARVTETSTENKTNNYFDPTVYGLPVLYLTGDATLMTKDNAVDLTYKYGTMLGVASVKWQGSSSLAYPKKNYTIKFDRNFEAKEGWGEQKKYCFKANYIDHSHSRNIVSCQLWGEIVKSRADVPAELSSLINGGAIDGFPCIIMLNDEFHGLYTWNIPKDGWMFGSPKAILCADAHTDATKFKALATLNGDFELEYVEDEDDADWVLTSINRAIQAVMDSNGADIDSVVGQYIDIPSAIDYFIHTVDENADDGTDKNYILVTYDGVKWYFSAYDRDTVYGLMWNGKSFLSPIGAVTFAKFAEIHQLMNLIYTNKKTELKARAVQLKNNIKSDAHVGLMFTNFIAQIPSQLMDEDARKWPTIPSTSASNLAQILNWYRLRRAYLDQLLESM